MSAYSHILSAVTSEVWALQPQKLRAMVGFLQLKAAGLEPDADVLASIKASAVHAAARSQSVAASGGGAVAVIPVFGLIMPRGNMMGDISGPRATSIEQLTQAFRTALNDPNIKAIVFDIDSPGGCVAGVPELASEIFEGRKKKPIVAVSDTLCASAAYYLAASCKEVVVLPSSLTGSIGVYCAHEDISGALEQAGVKVTLVSHGENKTAGNEFEALSDSAREDMQGRVDYYGAMFNKAVAKGRKITVADVTGKLGQGKMFNAQKAISSGMADRIGTLDDVLAGFGVSRGAPPSPSSSRITKLNERTGEQGAANVVQMPSARHEHADDVDCDCDCDQCVDGNCAGCTCDDCDCDGCTCDSATSARTTRTNEAQAAKDRLVMAHRGRELDLLGLAQA